MTVRVNLPRLHQRDPSPRRALQVLAMAKQHVLLGHPEDHQPGLVHRDKLGDHAPWEAWEVWELWEPEEKVLRDSICTTGAECCQESSSVAPLECSVAEAGAERDK